MLFDSSRRHLVFVNYTAFFANDGLNLIFVLQMVVVSSCENVIFVLSSSFNVISFYAVKVKLVHKHDI